MDKIIDINTINSQIPGSPEGIISELLNASFVEKIKYKSRKPLHAQRRSVKH